MPVEADSISEALLLDHDIDALVLDLALGASRNIWKYSGIQTGSGILVIYLDESDLNCDNAATTAQTAERLDQRLKTFFDTASAGDQLSH